MKKLILSIALAAMGIAAYAQKAAPAKKSVKDYFTELHGDGEGFKMQIEDTKNGYLKFEEVGMEGAEEMVMWRWGKKDLIGRVITGCGPACSVQLFTFYYGGNTNPVEEQVLPMKEIKRVLQDIENKFDQSDEYTGVKLTGGKIQLTDATVWYKMPQKGRKLQIGFLVNQVSDGEKFIPVLDLEPKGEKFVITQNYGTTNFK